jgi:hypothetical protein
LQDVLPVDPTEADEAEVLVVLRVRSDVVDLDLEALGADAPEARLRVARDHQRAVAAENDVGRT